MKRILHLLSLVMLFLIFLGFTNTRIINPCAGIAFMGDLARLSEQTLDRLAQDLGDKSSSSSEEGCRNALLGRITMAQGKHSEASNYFSRAALSLPELSDYFQLAKAHAELRNQDFKEATSIANALLNSQSALLSAQFKIRTQQILAEIAFKEKDHQQIIKTHSELLGRGLSDDKVLLFNLAASLGHMGEHEKADEIFKQLLLRFPLSSEAQTVEKLRGLAQYHLTLKENEKRFDQLIKNLAFDRVVADVDSLLAKNARSLKNEEKSALESYAQKSLVLNNRFDQGLRRARLRVQAKDSTAKDLENYAWGLAKVNRFIEASDYYSRFANISKDPEDKAKGCFFAGFSLYEASLYSMAQFSWQRCHGYMEKSALNENYLWYQALAALLNNDAEQASTELKELMHKFKKSSDIDKYTYFSGYALHQLNEKDAGDVFYKKLAHINVPTYYVMLARHALGFKGPSGTVLSADAFSRTAMPCNEPSCNNALLLQNLGFPDEARDMVLRNNMPQAQKLALLQYLGNYHDVWRKSYALKPGLKIDGNTIVAHANIRASHPVPYESIIEEMSRKYSIQKSLIAAIMGVESGFLLDAVSNRGARGPMQMMPFVAEQLASKLAIDQFSSDHLKEPKIAIELGALLLATLKRQFEDTYLVVAAYNAGAHNVQKWIDLFGHLPLPLRVERIPFEQTRTYVKKVLSTKSVYDALQGNVLSLVL